MSRRRFPVCPDFQGLVIGADFAEPMLRAGAAKVKGARNRPRDGRTRFNCHCQRGSSRAPLSRSGSGNVAGLEAALKEVFRVITRGVAS